MEIDQVQKYLNSIPNINAGGCGISALSIYRWLKKNNKLDDTKFIYLYREKYRYLNNSSILKKKNGKPQAPSHIALLYDGQFIDSSGEIKLTYGWVQIIDEEEFLKETLNNLNDWNNMFDRNNIPKIEGYLGIDLSDIKKEEVKQDAPISN